jgi:Tfp pilus assembly protein PilF
MHRGQRSFTGRRLLRIRTTPPCATTSRWRLIAAEIYRRNAQSSKKHLALKPNTPAAENQLGILAAKSGELALAEEHFRRALKMTPHFADASINLGTLLGQQGKDHEAEQQFREALASNPRSVQGWTNLAATLASEARYTEARESAQNAIRIDPTDEAARQILRC